MRADKGSRTSPFGRLQSEGSGTKKETEIEEKAERRKARTTDRRKPGDN